MIEFYKTVDGHVVKVPVVEGGCWISIVAPTPEERLWLSNQMEIVPEFSAAALDDEERPHVDHDIDEGQTLIIVDCPFVEDADEAVDSNITQYDTHPLSILLLPRRQIIVTVTLRENPSVQALTGRWGRMEGNVRHPQLLLDLLMHVSQRYQACLRDIDRQFKLGERRLRKTLLNGDLIRMLGLEKSLVYFSTSLKSFEAVLEKLDSGRILRLLEDERETLDDVIVEVRQATEMCEISSKIMNGTMDAFSNVISNNMNITIRRLTIITLVLAVPTIVFSFYGMNTSTLPLVDSWIYPFVIALVISVIVAIIFAKSRFFK